MFEHLGLLLYSLEICITVFIQKQYLYNSYIFKFKSYYKIKIIL